MKRIIFIYNQQLLSLGFKPETKDIQVDLVVRFSKHPSGLTCQRLSYMPDLAPFLNLLQPSPAQPRLGFPFPRCFYYVIQPFWLLYSLWVSYLLHLVPLSLFSPQLSRLRVTFTLNSLSCPSIWLCAPYIYNKIFPPHTQTQSCPLYFFFFPFS